ncbi:glycosyltransferase family 2 protein [Shewanella sp. 6_MG-2023]|uniref:glycosyltransferase family 2 protein n=1 Tax=Shewanella sp. 6_MG-2023 TaxID=3062660 RepID=UPI0026E22983|nr:glycosyltransferase [Shewanella sp. 6_MG-2023]MDO6617642.1 glycosyltransferase [Shewanella sp. 6_MG-2023]
MSESMVSPKLDVNVHLDFVSYNDGVWTMSGWLVCQTENPRIRLLSQDQTELLSKWQAFERADVKDALGLPEEAIVKGFVACVASGDVELDALILEIDSTEFNTSTLQPQLINNPEVIFNALGDAKTLFVEDLQAIISSKPASEDAVAEALSEQAQSNIHEARRVKIEHFFDDCFILDNNLFYFKGWALTDKPLSDVVVTDAAGNEIEITECYRFIRHDLNEKLNLSLEYEAGFVCACRLPDEFDATSVTLNIDGGHSISATISNHVIAQTKLEILKAYLALIDVHQAGFFSQGQPAVLKHLADIWQSERLMEGATPQVQQFGDAIQSPVVSLIIPIYGRYDFIQHQIAMFLTDIDMANHEIIYVLDDPKIAREFDITCHGVFNTYSMPFKTVYAGKNLGFAGANNLGVNHACGEYVLALNSDVLPSESGWLSRLVSKFNTLEDVGILGAKLLYEDNTLQHIGMEFSQDAYYPGIWMNFHPHKGMPSQLVNKDKTVQAELVTGACMLLKKDFYQSIKGFDTRYILGDFEDSDLCLKVYQQQKKIYLDTEETLFHLERLSQNLVDSGDWKYKLTLLNGLYQKNKWGHAIEEVKQNHV